MSLTRREPMPPGKPLKRTQFRSSSATRAATTLRRSEPKHARPKDTGFSPAVKLAVRTRAGNGDIDFARCECCAVWLGRYGGQVQHRVARGSGGRGPKAPWWINAIVNAALLCGTSFTGCHGRAERREDDMEAMGFWLESTANPALESLMLHGDQGGVTVWLAADGSYAYEAPERGAA